MPAVTIADPTKLPRIPRAEGDAPARPASALHNAPRALEGEGFEVRRAFAEMDLRFADPFLMLDHMGAVEYAPGEAKGAPDHPHRGFETVTYMLDGVLEHRDSNGDGGLITDGATQWMTAGAGIVHSEMPTEQIVMEGGLFHGVQLWVNLPAAQKWSPPEYQDIEANAVSLLASDDAGALVRLIAGELGDFRGPGATRTPITYAPASRCRGGATSTRWRTCSLATGPSVPRRRRFARANSRSSVTAAMSWSPARRARTAALRTSRCCCSAGCRFGSRSRGTDHS